MKELGVHPLELRGLGLELALENAAIKDVLQRKW
jgi:hypothetical protein